MDVSTTINGAIGEIKMHHTFNGAAPISRGWMVCDGSIINQTNYDAIHGSGKYVRDQVASGPLVGKNLPNLVNKYPVGVASTTQTGSSTITPVGVTGHSLNLQHNHQWYDASGNSLVSDGSFLSNGAPSTSFSTFNHVGATAGIAATSSGGGNFIGGDQYTTNALNSPQSIQPESIEVLFIIKVI